jgi:hypothetical protein
MMARTGAFEIFANAAVTACASSILLVVSTMMAPPSPTISVTLAIE